MTKIFIDTDMSSDCDDAGAFAVLHNLANNGRAEILGCTHCIGEDCTSIAVKAVNAWFGKPDLPIGKSDKLQFDGTDKLIGEYISNINNVYLQDHSKPKLEKAVKLLRRTLAENTDVVLVTIGMLNNISELLKSPPDEISDKTGMELCEHSVKCMYTMGGHFTDPDYSEFNIKLDIASAAYVAKSFPKPINYIGFELGENIITGKNLKTSDEKCPVKIAYTPFGGTRSSWDPITIYCAINPQNSLFKRHGNVSVSFDEYGRTIISESGKDSYFEFNAPKEVIENELDKYIIG